jgi:hypothetical protein
MSSISKNLDNYVFNDEYEKNLLGMVFRNPERIHDISEKYPFFVEKKNEDVFLFLKDRIEKGNLTKNDTIFTSGSGLNKNYLFELEQLTPTDGNFNFILKKALEEKAKREYIKSSHQGTKNIFVTQNIQEFIELRKQELEEIEKSFEIEEPLPEEETENGIIFPYEIMNGLAGDFASVYSNCLEGAQEFFYLSCLTCMGSLFSNKVTLKSELHTEPRLYTLLIGQSAYARKSTILSKTSDFFKDVIYDYRTYWGAGSAEGLCKIIEENEPLLILFDEFKTFISKCKIENSVLLPMMTSLFEKNLYQNATKKTSINLQNVHLSILGASTISTYERMWTPNFMEIGFLNRVFIVPGDSERKHSIPKEIGYNEKKILKDRLIEILSFVEQARGDCTKLFLPIDENAAALFHEWYMALPRTEYSKRLETNAVRFMILLALNVQKTRVDVEIMESVINLMDWQYKVRRAYDPIDAENCMARMEQSIRNNLVRKGCLKDRELKQKVHAYRSGLWIYNTAIKNLMASKEIQMKNKKWFLNEEKV